MTLNSGTVPKLSAASVFYNRRDAQVPGEPGCKACLSVHLRFSVIATAHSINRSYRLKWAISWRAATPCFTAASTSSPPAIAVAEVGSPITPDGPKSSDRQPKLT